MLAPPERLAALLVPVDRRRVHWPLRCIVHPASMTLALGRVVDVDISRPSPRKVMSPVVMTHILAIAADNSLADLAPVWHHPVDLAPPAGAEMRRNRRLTCGFSWWSLGDSNP